MKKIVNYILVIFILGNILFLGCKKDKEDQIPINNKSTISGMVLDELNSPLAGVQVTAYGKTVITEEDGAFIFSDVPIDNSRYIVNFSKTGYFDVSRSSEVLPGELADIVVGMTSKTGINSGTVSFLASVGGVLDLTASGCKITFPANNFVIESTNAVYNGNVHASACFIDPSKDDFSKYINGGDFKGKALSGKDNILQMFSGLNIELTDDAGNKLQLNPNVKAPATVEFIIPPDLVASAPASIGIWTYNTTTGQQTQSATASRNGDKVTSQIGHFSSWYCNQGYTSIATVSGTVTDGNNSPVSGVRVSVGQQTVYTNNAGKYTCKVPSGISIVVGIPDYFGNTSIIPSTITTNSTHTINFSVPAMRMISGKLVDCNEKGVIGKLILKWVYNSNNYFSTVFSKTDGSFSLPINSGEYCSSAILMAFANGTSKHIIIEDEVNNIGNIKLCISTTNNQLPTIVTSPVKIIDTSSVIFVSKVFLDGGYPVTSQGICWSTSPNPTINNNIINDETNLRSFNSTINGLSRNIVYYVRAYATNSADTAYGNEISFKIPIFNIGQLYEGGAIFYIDNTKLHGFITALSGDVDSEWGCMGQLISATDTANGNTNTSLIVNNCTQLNNAASNCYNLILNGYSDWYLPSKYEMKLLYDNRMQINNFLHPQATFWTSTEFSKDSVYTFNFSIGTLLKSRKNVTEYSRAIRKF